MPQSQTQSIPREQFLIMAANLLHKILLDAPRTQAKNMYKDLDKGQVVQLANVKMEDKSTARFSVTLDHSEFKGKINFGAFRASLGLLVSNLGQALTDKKDIQVFTQEDDPNVVIFGITAVTREESNANIMVLGADTGDGQPSVMLRLQYIDNSQFSDPSTPQEQSA